MSDIPDYQWTKEQAAMFKAAWNGTADAATQRAVIAHLVEIICGVNRISLVSGQPDLTAFNEGRRWVARQIQNAVTLPLDKLVKEELHDNRPSRLPTATQLYASASTGPRRTARNAPKQPA